MDLSVDDGELRHKPANNIVAERRVAERVIPFRDLTTDKGENPVKKGNDNNVLLPPQDMAGELGKPVVLPSNLSGESTYFTHCVFYNVTFNLTYSPWEAMNQIILK